MSRVGKMPIAVPQGVDVQIANNQITVKGANGTLARTMHSLVEVKKDGSTLSFAPANDGMEANAMSGTMRALVNNMVNGVSKGFEKKLNLVGVGFRAQAQGVGPVLAAKGASLGSPPATDRQWVTEEVGAQDQTVEVDTLDQRARLGGIRCGCHTKSLLGQEAVQEASEPRIVVDDQEMGAIGCVHRSRIEQTTGD